ncbi:hemolysin family protein [Desulfonatronovibrio hydrogenovorans]|uniref:hemolysin family protein n=1 Tax=Desulfonatronovibrio hydrogenovorans TaxID=53245 RepID=UPI00068B77E4|nr:hemolysin family protein [Desulfonatronovibrio hydrogenovorans]
MMEHAKDSSLALEFLVIMFLVAVNGVLAMSEIALVKSRKIRLKELARKGRRGAVYAIHLIRHPNRFLSTIQIGITLMGILSGVYGGAVIAHHLGIMLDDVPYLAPYSTTISYGLVVIFITYLLLVLGELIPKRLAMLSPERISSRVARPMLLLSKLAGPAVAVLSISTDGLLRLFGISRHKEEPLSENEVKQMFRHAARSGEFEPSEVKMVEKVLKLDDQTVGSLMTRPQDIVWFSQDEPWADILEKVKQSGHTCYPVRNNESDGILGIVHTKDLIGVADGSGTGLETIIKPAGYVKRSMNALEMMEQFKRSRAHMIIVVDNQDQVLGLVTINDVLQAITGQLPSPKWPHEPWIIHRDDGSLLLDGRLGLDELKELIKVQVLSGEEDDGLDTLAGLVLTRMGKVPVSGDRFEQDGFLFEVVDMDGMQVDKVLVKEKPDNETSPNGRQDET